MIPLTRRRLVLAGLALVALTVAGVAAAGYLANANTVSGGGVIAAPGGPNVTIAGSTTINLSQPPTSNEVRLRTSDGNISFRSDDTAKATVHKDDITGTWTNLSGLAVATNELEVDPDDKPAVNVSGGADTLDFRATTDPDDGIPDFVYSGNAGPASVTLRTVPANTQLRAADQTGLLLDVATSDGNGHVTFTGMPTSSHTVTLTTGNSAPRASNLTPDSNLNTKPSQLSAQVNDSDFPTGDNVTVTFNLEGSQIDQQTVSSNGTVTTSVPSSGQTGGLHNWSVDVEDGYGQTNSGSATYVVPDTLYIYNETSPGTKITSPTEIEVEFYASNGSVYSRSTTNGEIDFSGLPVDQRFVVRADAPDFYSRRIYVPSLIEQQQIYLLNSTTNPNPAGVTFTLDDDSGEFTPADQSILYIEKPLNISGSTSYQIITSDYFSATREVASTLENDRRYRLRIEGPDGDTRILGAYRTAGDDASVLSVGKVGFAPNETVEPVFRSGITTINGQRVIRLYYQDPSNQTDDLRLRVYNQTGQTVLRPETTEQGPFGTYVETIPISDTSGGVRWNVTYHANRTGGDDVSGEQFLGDVAEIAKDLGLDPQILSMIAYLIIIGVLGLTAISYPRYAGIPTTAVASALVAIGAVTIHPLLLGGAGVISLLFAVGGGGGQ